MNLTADRLRSLFHYDQDSGRFTRLVRTTQRTRVGEVAGSQKKSTGYRYIGIDSRVYAEHRLAWFYANGEWPRGQIDHINGDPIDNRLLNLRDVSQSVNQQNVRGARAHSISGLLGVTCRGRGRWSAHIDVDGRRVRLGRFGSPEAAHAAYIRAKREHHEGCTI